MELPVRLGRVAIIKAVLVGNPSSLEVQIVPIYNYSINNTTIC